MELIAASRIVKAQQRVAAARPYSEQLTEVIASVAAAGGGVDHPLLRPRESVRTVGYVAITADRGLAGAYNSTVMRTTERAVRDTRNKGMDYALWLAGRKGDGSFRYRQYQIEGSHTGFSEQPSYENAQAIAAQVMDAYRDGAVDQVEIVYTRFLSMGSQRVVTSRLLPLERPDDNKGASPGAAGSGQSHDEQPKAVYELEPEADEILERLLPRYVEARIFAALLDAAASEQAARQRAMKSATDNAEELIKGLSVVANKVRQAGITTEIMEIVGGAEALRQTESTKSHHQEDRSYEPAH